MHDAPIGGDEQHVERQPGIRHPHGRPLAIGEQEQHAGVGRQRAAEHEAARLLLRRLGKLDMEDPHARRRLDPHLGAPKHHFSGKSYWRRCQQCRKRR